MSKGFRRLNGGIMKSDAMIDYDRIKTVCERLNIPVYPSGTTKNKIEDATAAMLVNIPSNEIPDLLRGYSYYFSILP